MFIDIIVVVLIIWAVIKGMQKGLIVALFSILAFIIGLAAAIKLSAVVADYVGNAVKVSQQWLPVISFAVVFIIVVLLVRLGALFIQRVVNLAFLGWANRLGGAILYAALYIFIFSVILFYANQVNLVSEKTKNASVTYKYVEPLGPRVIDGFGKVLPFFRDMFTDLKEFFGTVSEKVQESK